MAELGKLQSIAIYLPNLSGGGAERVMLNLATAFARRGLRVTLLLDRREGALLDEVPAGVTVRALGVSRTVLALPRLIAFLRIERPDVLLSSLGHNNIVSLWAKRLAFSESQVVVCQHNTVTEEAKAERAWQHRILPSLYRLFLDWADGVVAVSRGVADDMAAVTGTAREHISVIYNPCLVPGFDRLAAEAVGHPWLQGPRTEPVFLGVGRLVPQKDFATLIRALALLNQSRPARLLILGEGPLRPQLEDLARELRVFDRVGFPGFQRNPLPYIREADALVMSSRWEGFGNVLVEALGCGTPVISTDCPHGPSEILNRGEFGLLTGVADVPAMAEGMQSVLDQPAAKARLQMRAQEFQVDRVADRYLRLLEHVVAHREARRPRGLGQAGLD